MELYSSNRISPDGLPRLSIQQSQFSPRRPTSRCPKVGMYIVYQFPGLTIHTSLQARKSASIIRVIHATAILTLLSRSPSSCRAVRQARRSSLLNNSMREPRSDHTPTPSLPASNAIHEKLRGLWAPRNYSGEAVLSLSSR